MEGFDGSGGTGSLGLGAMAGGQSATHAAAGGGGAGAAASRPNPSRGIGIGIGVAAGAATAHRGMKRELSDSNLGGAAGWDGHESGWAGMGGDARRSMSEQQKLERRVSLWWCMLVVIGTKLLCYRCLSSTPYIIAPTSQLNIGVGFGTCGTQDHCRSPNILTDADTKKSLWRKIPEGQAQ